MATFTTSMLSAHTNRHNQSLMISTYLAGSWGLRQPRDEAVTVEGGRGQRTGKTMFFSPRVRFGFGALVGVRPSPLFAFCVVLGLPQRVPRGG